MPILNLHEFTIQMLLLPPWLTMMCTVQYSIVFLLDKMNNNGMFISGYVSATSPTRTKMFAISISSPLHEKQWRAFLMRMILHQELIGWCFLPNSTWCIAFSIERNITKSCSFCEVKSSVWIICGWILACGTCRLNFHMLMWYISYHRVQTSWWVKCFI